MAKKRPNTVGNIINILKTESQIGRCFIKLAPSVGLEPTTFRLTAGRSTIELRGNSLRCWDAFPLVN